MLPEKKEELTSIIFDTKYLIKERNNFYQKKIKKIKNTNDKDKLESKIINFRKFNEDFNYVNNSYNKIIVNSIELNNAVLDIKKTKKLLKGLPKYAKGIEDLTKYLNKIKNSKS